VELRFVGAKLNYDLVPMLATSQADYQILLKKDGSRRLTSVTKHTEFVRSRTRHSDTLAGRVKFNECVRLFKWWRFVRIDASNSIDEVRTTTAILNRLMSEFFSDDRGEGEGVTSWAAASGWSYRGGGDGV
jgi:hypothetical protein